MRLTNRILPALAIVLAGATATAAAPAAKQRDDAKPGYDGVWQISLVAESGLCDTSYRYAIAIDNGSVRYIPGPGSSPASVSGQIGNDGRVDLDIRRSIASVDAVGRLNGKTGSGTWRLGLLGCSGRWNAQRQTVTANR